MRTIEEIIDAYDDDESSISDEEYEQLYHYICEKVKRNEKLDTWELCLLLDCEAMVDQVYNESVRHGYVRYSYIIKIDNEYYSLYGYSHDDYGIDNLEPQVLVPVELKEVVVKKWVKKEET